MPPSLPQDTCLTLQPVALGPERRSGADRRRRTGLPALWHSLRHRRRRGPRRPEDAAGEGYYLDVVAPGVLLAAAAVILCSCSDSVLTLRLLEQGATEVNPLMRRLIAVDAALFVQIKIAITLAGVLIIATHAHFRLLRILRGRHALYGLAAMYLTLNGYQLALLNT